MRSFTSSRPVWSASSTARASVMSRRSSERLPHGSSSTRSSHVRIQLCSGLWPLLRSSRSISRSTCARTFSGSGSVGGLRSVVVERVVVALAELLADRGHLLAQQELALRLVHALGDVVADALGHHQLGQRLARPGEHQLQPLVDVDRLEHGELGLDLVVGPRRHGVGQRAGLVHGAQDLGQPPRAALLGDLLRGRPAALG